LLPQGLSTRSGEDLEANIVAAGTHKVVSSEPTIADVCEACNNGPLSELDQYVCTLYERYFIHLVHSGDRVKFEFDFDLLLRWLLKVGYNVARARRGKWPVSSLADVRDYILGREELRPSSRILLQLVPPAKVEPGIVKDLPAATEAPPIFHRVAIFDTKYSPGFRAGFLITLYSYYFYVLLEEDEISSQLRERVFKALLGEIPGGYRLRPDKRADIYPSSLDMFEVGLRSGPLVRNIVNWNKWKEREKR